MQVRDSEILETLLQAIVDKPEMVKVERKIDEMGVLLTVTLDEKDAGAVIGKDGSTIQSIRKIMKIVGMKQNARVNIKLDVPERRGNKNHVKPNTKDQSTSRAEQ
jgi:predicted RNA-binding protein YlqC (UPF0109 family)